MWTDETTYEMSCDESVDVKGRRAFLARVCTYPLIGRASVPTVHRQKTMERGHIS